MIRSVIIDDEPLAINVIESYIGKINIIENIKSFTNPLEAFSFLQKEKVDILFLDINMSELSGLDLLKTLFYSPVVIITTAYQEYALESMEYNVIDYLVKPISFERFLKSINKYTNLRNPEITERIPNTVAESNQFITVKENKRQVNIDYADIYHIECIRDYVKIHANSKTVVTKTTLTAIEESLPENEFIRIHRSYIVAINKIETFSQVDVEVNGLKIPIGATYKSPVLKRLNFYFN